MPTSSTETASLFQQGGIRGARYASSEKASSPSASRPLGVQVSGGGKPRGIRRQERLMRRKRMWRIFGRACFRKLGTIQWCDSLAWFVSYSPLMPFLVYRMVPPRERRPQTSIKTFSPATTISFKRTRPGTHGSRSERLPLLLHSAPRHRSWASSGPWAVELQGSACPASSGQWRKWRAAEADGEVQLPRQVVEVLAPSSRVSLQVEITTQRSRDQPFRRGSTRARRRSRRHSRRLSLVARG